MKPIQKIRLFATFCLLAFSISAEAAPIVHVFDNSPSHLKLGFTWDEGNWVLQMGDESLLTTGFPGTEDVSLTLAENEFPALPGLVYIVFSPFPDMVKSPAYGSVTVKGAHGLIYEFGSPVPDASSSLVLLGMACSFVGLAKYGGDKARPKH